ncbi:MAG: dTDP-4-dehydrorhamnose 3,5-epimerase family protein [Acidimicrobiales bacterium]
MPEIQRTSIEGVLIAEPDVHSDDRGSFAEVWRKEWLPAGGPMVQANVSRKGRGSLVGLHYHLSQADFWHVIEGTADMVLYDLRADSSTKARSLKLRLGAQAPRGVYIPSGVAHGFLAATDLVLCYLVDRYYNPDDELGVAWDDPDLGIDWGTVEPVLSQRDQQNPRLRDLPAVRPA